jgi:hypothetical protein
MDEWCWRSVVRSYHLLKEPATYRELGTDYFDRYSTERLKRRSLAQLQRPCYRVTLPFSPPLLSDHFSGRGQLHR